MKSKIQSEVKVENGLKKCKSMWNKIYENRGFMKMIEILGFILPIFYLIADVVYNSFYKVNAQEYYHVDKEYFHVSTQYLFIKIAAVMTIFLLIYMFIKFITGQSKWFSIFMCVLFGLELGIFLFNLFMLVLDNEALCIFSLDFLNEIAEWLGSNFALAIILTLLINPIIILYFFLNMRFDKRKPKNIIDYLKIVFSICVFVCCFIDGIVLLNGISIILSATPQTKRVYEIIEDKQFIILSNQDDRCLVVKFEYDKQNQKYILDTSSYEFINKYEHHLAFIEMKNEPIIKNERFD